MTVRQWIKRWHSEVNWGKILRIVKHLLEIIDTRINFATNVLLSKFGGGWI